VLGKSNSNISGLRSPPATWSFFLPEQSAKPPSRAARLRDQQLLDIDRWRRWHAREARRRLDCVLLPRELPKVLRWRRASNIAVQHGPCALNEREDRAADERGPT
jgi:hypothetical protein